MLKRNPHAIHARPKLYADPLWDGLAKWGWVSFSPCSECGLELAPRLTTKSRRRLERPEAEFQGGL